MNRRDFGKSALAMVAAATVTPKILAEYVNGGKMKSYAIVGNRVDQSSYLGRQQDSIIDYSQIPIGEFSLKITHTSPCGDDYVWYLVPLLPFDENNEDAAMDRLLVFEEPREGREYSAGVQTGYGLNRNEDDMSCISVVRKGSREREEPDTQVAEFVSKKINPADLTLFAACIGAWYKKCKFSIEQITNPGDVTQNQLKIMGFNRFFSAVSPKGYKRDGWYTTKSSLSVMMDRFTEAVREGWYKPQSIQLRGDITKVEGTKYLTAVVKAAAQSYMAQI
jgi:hypothetical protein